VSGISVLRPTSDALCGEDSLEEHPGRDAVHDLTPSGTGHVRLQQRPLGLGAREALVHEAHGQPGPVPQLVGDTPRLTDRRTLLAVERERRSDDDPGRVAREGRLRQARSEPDDVHLLTEIEVADLDRRRRGGDDLRRVARRDTDTDPAEVEGDESSGGRQRVTGPAHQRSVRRRIRRRRRPHPVQCARRC